MTRDQINQLNMMDTTDQVLSSFSSVWTPNTIMAGIISTWRSHLSAINTNDTLQKTISQGATLTKEEAMNNMVTSAVAAANAGKAYAGVTGNTDLLPKMSATKSQILKAADTDADDICQNIHDDLAPFVANMAAYGVTPTTHTILQNNINAFSVL